MILNLYESIYAIAKVNNQSVDSTMNQLDLLDLRVSDKTMIKGLETFNQKFKLIDDKKKALTNISNKTREFSDSNVTILNNAFETARKAYQYRLSLELSVLESQLKSIEMEINNIKLMTANQFTTKYGA